MALTFNSWDRLKSFTLWVVMNWLTDATVVWQFGTMVLHKNILLLNVIFILGGFKFEAQHALVIDETPLRVF
jgi:hypothetical protein